MGQKEHFHLNKESTYVSLYIFLHYKNPLPLPEDTLWNEVTRSIQQLRSGESCFPSFRANYLYILFGILLYRRFAYPPAYVFFQSFICIRMEYE